MLAASDARRRAARRGAGPEVRRHEPRAAARPRRARVRRCRRSTCPARARAPPTRPAVQLFVERAQEAKPSFELTDDNLEAVAEICRRLEGIPLAIELAAARVKLMTPEQIVGRLGEKRLSFLTGGGGGQDSLKDAIEWSYNLLDDLGKSLFARLGVFVGGASLETAETVAGRAARARVRRGARRRRRARRQRPRPPGRGRRRRAALPDARDDPRVRARAARRARRARGRAHAAPQPLRPARRDGRAGAHAQRPGGVARAAQRGERQHPRRARLVVRVGPGRARASGSRARSSASGASAA